MEFQKDQIYTVKIEDIAAEGEGIGKVDGFSLFVKDALPGDVAKVRLIKVKKNYAYARLEEVITPSPDRVEPRCAFHRQCGGCQIQALSYEKQLAFKQAKVENALVRIGGFAPETVRGIMEPIIGMEEPWRYRNKAQYPVGCGKDGRLITGFYAGRTHSIIANTDCLLGAPENRKILETILKHMEECRIAAYDEKSGQGLVRHVLLRKGFSTGELMVCIVINAEKMTARKAERAGGGKDGAPWIPGQNRLVDKLALLPGMTSVSINFNPENTNVIMGADTVTIWGRDKMRDRMHLFQTDGEEFVKTDRSVIYEISPRSFYQVNPVQAEKLYSVALSYAGLTGRETVWDLYCGIGTISLFLAQAAGYVYGVEEVPEAVADARENAKKNGIANATFFAGKAEEVLPAFYGRTEGEQKNGEEGERDMRRPDVIVADPPRKGCDERCLRTMLKMQPRRIVYVSCAPATLARDLKILCEGGYELKKARVCDQFCQGVHVECVAQLVRQGVK